MILPKISIIIPVYNVELYIAECLQSVMRQTYHGLMECIIVDDCGTDNSIVIVEKLVEQYDGLIEFRVLRNKKNEGVACSRNTGIDAALGDYVFFLDGDDYISDDCIEVLVNQTRKGNFDVVFGNHVCFFEDGTDGIIKQEERYIKLDSCMLSGDQYVMKFLEGRLLPTGVWNKLFNIRYIKKNRMYFVPNIVYEDSAFTFLMHRYPTKLCFMDKLTYYYRTRRKGSIVNQLLTDNKKRKDALFRIWMILRQNCSIQLYDEVEELHLHVYGKWFFGVCRDIGGGFYKDFCLLHHEYPYQPFRIWLVGRQSFDWFCKRLIWTLPSSLGYLCLRTQYLIKRLFHFCKRLLKNEKS